MQKLIMRKILGCMLTLLVIGFNAATVAAEPTTANITTHSAAHPTVNSTASDSMHSHIRGTFPSLPSSIRDSKFIAAQTAFEERAKLFLQGRSFHRYTKDRAEKEILKEYQQLDNWRHNTWYSEETNERLVSRPDFIVAQDLLEKGYYKRPHLLAFQYNQTDGTYNSSTIVLNGHRFLAMEAPQNEKLTSNFFKLLQNYQVQHLVRLTTANEKGVKKSMPYWLNRVKKDPKTQALTLNAPFEGRHKSYPIQYYAIDSWQDNRGIAPEILLKLVQSLQKNYKEADLIACHCSGGVGRTGTFLTAFILAQEIERQIAAHVDPDHLDLSIEKIVLQLSLQRVYMVSRPAQYTSLYRFVDLYIKNLKKGIPSKATVT